MAVVDISGEQPEVGGQLEQPLDLVLGNCDRLRWDDLRIDRINPIHRRKIEDTRDDRCPVAEQDECRRRIQTKAEALSTIVEHSAHDGDNDVVRAGGVFVGGARRLAAAGPSP